MGHQPQGNRRNTVYFNITRRGTQIGVGLYWLSPSKKRMVSLTISYSRHIFHIPGCQVVKFDCAGILV